MVYGLNYLHQRNIDDQQISDFGLAYLYNNQLYGVSNSPSFEKLCQFIHKLTELKIDLNIYNNCILIPIFDLYNNIVSFAARHLTPGTKQKFIGVKGFKKTLLLFGLNLAYEDILKMDEVILVEGYWEVIALSKIGIRNVVALCGCSIKDTQVSYLMRFTKNFKILLDPDKAGIEGSERVAKVINTLGGNPEILQLQATVDIDEFLTKNNKEEFIKSCGLSQKYLKESLK